MLDIDRIGLGWVGLDWIKLDWVGLGWVGLGWERIGRGSNLCKYANLPEHIEMLCII